MMLLLALASLAAAADGAAAITVPRVAAPAPTPSSAKVDPQCTNGELHGVTGERPEVTRPVGPHTLDKEPDAVATHPVMRVSDGCTHFVRVSKERERR